MDKDLNSIIQRNMESDVLKESICKNKDYIIKNIKDSEKVITCLKKRNILTSSQYVDFELVIEEVLRKNEAQAFVSALQETGNEEVAEKIGNLTDIDFKEFIGGAQVATNQDTKVRKNLTTSEEDAKRIVALEDENINLTYQINHLTTIQKGIRQEIEDKRKRIEELRQLEDQNHKLKENLENVERKKDAEIRLYKEQISKLEKENARLSTELEEKQKQLFRQNTEIEDLKKQNEEMKTKMSQMNEKIEVHNQEMKIQMSDLIKYLK